MKDYYLYTISNFDVTKSGLTEAVDNGLVVHQFHLLRNDNLTKQNHSASIITEKIFLAPYQDSNSKVEHNLTKACGPICKYL